MKTSRPIRAFLAVALLAAVPIAMAAPPAAAAVQPQTIYQGNAFGTLTATGTAVKSGRSANIVLGCRTAAGRAVSNRVLDETLPGVFSAGQIDTSLQALQAGGAQTSRSVARAKDVNLLGGRIKAQVVQAESQSTRSLSNGALGVSGAGSSLTGLVIDGTPQSGSPDPNTRIDLPHIGYVILNEQMPRLTETTASLAINMIHVHVTKTPNPTGLPSGSQLVVSHAMSQLDQAAGPLGGTAYGSTMNVGDKVASGPSYAVYQACLGTDGAVRSNAGSGQSVPERYSAGSITNTVQGTVDMTQAVGETKSKIHNANVLLGQITADMITADSHASKTASGKSFSDAGSGFGGLVVQGQPGIGDNVQPNTKIDLPIGTVWFHRIIRTDNSIEVRMIEVIVGDGVPNFPAGTHIVLGVARSNVR
jgi:hypothetical protein